MGQAFVRREFDRWRQEMVGQVQGVVLEIGAGGGQNFPFYNASKVVRVEAVEPDQAMLAFARQTLTESPVPIQLSSALVETLPFPSASFDSAVATLVFCSVTEPEWGLREVWRVLKPGGALLLLEHVRAQGKKTAWLQDGLVPLTTRLLANCYWNRDTGQAIVAASFQLTHLRQVSGGLQPMLLIKAVRPQTP